MDTREAFQLLTLASARDGRTVDAAVASVWADDLIGVSLADAVEAARDHYRESTAWLMPAHVIERVRAKQKKLVKTPTMSERVIDCTDRGREHRWLQDGTCMNCETRR